MTELTLSIFDPNTLLPHRAGIAGLALALEANNADDLLVSWEVTEDAVKLSWNCSDKEAILDLIQQTYHIEDGYLDVPAMNLDEQGKYTFTEGVMTTFLQHNQQRKLLKETTKIFSVEDTEFSVSFRPVDDCYYTKDFKEIFDKKGVLKTEIAIKGHHLPGLVECFAHGTYKESSKGFLALVFLPLACSYYRLSNYRSALIIPEVTNLKEWVKRRQNYAGRTYQNFRSSNAGESALRFLLQEQLIEDSRDFKVNYCEVYQLGKQQWDGNQSYLKQAVYRVKVEDEVLELYQSAYQFFKPQIRTNDKGEKWWAESKILPWLCDNLITGKPWYSGFYEFYKQNKNKLYEKKGLISMSEKLNDFERIFFDAIQGAFRNYLRKQIKQANSQGRKLDYPQVTDKVINTLQRPSTQQDFAKVTVDFLSRHRSQSTKGVGAEIYQWLHKDNNWRQARDLALLAIASYTGKGKDGSNELPELSELSEEILDESNTEVDSEEALSIF